MNALFKLSILLFLLVGCKKANSQDLTYYCPPCPNDCHDKHYEQPGICPICGMDLVQRTVSSFDGFQSEIVKIKSGNITLNAAYYSPINASTPTASVVIVHGSAPSTYEDVAYYTSIATRLGLSVLAFDKRGVGQSEGVYERFTVEGSKAWFNLLSQDVSACINWLKEKPEIDNEKIGLFGGSQAGWIMPLVASRDNSVKFIISGEGAAVSAGEEKFHSDLTGDGSGEGISIEEADKKLKSFDGERGFDPRVILKSLKAKTLWFFGTKDDVIPVNASIEVLNELNNSNFEIIMLPNGNHNFENVETGVRYELIEYIRPWLIKIGIIN